MQWLENSIRPRAYTVFPQYVSRLTLARSYKPLSSAPFKYAMISFLFIVITGTARVSGLRILLEIKIAFAGGHTPVILFKLRGDTRHCLFNFAYFLLNDNLPGLFGFLACEIIEPFAKRQNGV